MELNGEKHKIKISAECYAEIRRDERAKVFAENENFYVRLPQTEYEELDALLTKLGVDDNDDEEGLPYPYTLAERIQLLDDTRKDDLEYADDAYEQLQAENAALFAGLGRTSVELTELKTAFLAAEMPNEFQKAQEARINDLESALIQARAERDHAEETLKNWVAFDKST